MGSGMNGGDHDDNELSLEAEYEYIKMLFGQAVMELEETRKVLIDTESALMAMTAHITTVSDTALQLAERIRRHAQNLVAFTSNLKSTTR